MIFRPQSRPWHRLRTRQAPSAPDRVVCRICHFPVDSTAEPGEGFPTAFTVTGTRYVWTAAGEALSTLDKAVMPAPNPRVSCPFCGGTAYLYGNRGTQ